MKSERGSITLFVLIAMIFFLTIAFTAYASASSKLQGQNGEIERIKASYGQDLTEAGLATLYDQIVNKEETVDNGSYTINGEKGSSTNPTIPKGFKTVNTSTSSWGDGTVEPTLASVNAGLVIEDESGNQFVWIPVDGVNLKYEKHVYSKQEENDTSSTSDTGNGNWKTYYYRQWNDWRDNGVNEYSVKKYGGFYVGRYEAGIPEEADFFANSNGATYYKDEKKNVTTYKPVSKANYPSWNYISQEKAKVVSEKMYNNPSVKSNLIDGVAWDTITQWIENEGIKSVTDSSTWGNYSNSSFNINGLYAPHTYSNSTLSVTKVYKKGSYSRSNGSRTETATGITTRNCEKNIFDFAGNMYEWTTETGTKNGTSQECAVLRGGGFYYSGGNGPASYRGGYNLTTNFNVHFGFRVALYLK